MSGVRARVFALLAALILLLPGGASARAEYYCQMMGHVVTACCCETDAASKAPAPTQELQAADCCQRISSAARSASLGTHEALKVMAAAALAAIAPEPIGVAVAVDTGSSCAESTQAPLAIGPPLFVKHCALLS